MKLLLDCHGIDPWIGDRQMCETALHRAARNGHTGCMRLLLEQVLHKQSIKAKISPQKAEGPHFEISA